MEDSTSEYNSRKRVRVASESDTYSTDSKRVRVDTDSSESADTVDSVDSVPDSPDLTKIRHVSSKYERVDSEPSELDSPTVKKIRDDILEILDDFDTATDRDPLIEDLDSVIKSFEEEILHPAPASASASDSGELGYLLEASDDELGLPPAISPSDEQSKHHPNDVTNIPSEGFGFGESVEFENELPSYDPFGFGFGEETGSNDDDNGEFVTVGGLFDYSEASDYSEFSWRPESLPAL